MNSSQNIRLLFLFAIVSFNINTMENNTQVSIKPDFSDPNTCINLAVMRHQLQRRPKELRRLKRWVERAKRGDVNMGNFVPRVNGR